MRYKIIYNFQLKCDNNIHIQIFDLVTFSIVPAQVDGGAAYKGYRAVELIWRAFLST